MKRLLTVVAVLLCVSALPALALDTADRAAADQRLNDRTTVIDDVIKMSRAGVSDDSILDFVRNQRGRFVVSADDIIAMNDAHVSRAVINAMVDQAQASDDRGRTTVRERVVVEPVPVGYYGWYDPWYYDPFFYGPRISVGFRFGGGYYRAPFYRHHRRW